MSRSLSVVLILTLLLIVSAGACVIAPEQVDPAVFWLPALVAIPLAIITIVLGMLILYYVLLVRAILEMLDVDANKVLLAFSFVALVPAPPLILLGVLILVIWSIHKRDLAEA